MRLNIVRVLLKMNILSPFVIDFDILTSIIGRKADKNIKQKKT